MRGGEGRASCLYLWSAGHVYTEWSAGAQSDSQQLHLVWPAVGPGLVSTQPRPGQSGLHSLLPTATQLSLCQGPAGGIISAGAPRQNSQQLKFKLFPLLTWKLTPGRLSEWVMLDWLYALLKSLQGRRWGRDSGCAGTSRDLPATNDGSELVWQLLVTATFPGVGWDRVSFLYYAALWGLETLIFT